MLLFLRGIPRARARAKVVRCGTVGGEYSSGVNGEIDIFRGNAVALPCVLQNYLTRGAHGPLVCGNRASVIFRVQARDFIFQFFWLRRIYFLLFLL